MKRGKKCVMSFLCIAGIFFMIFSSEASIESYEQILTQAADVAETTLKNISQGQGVAIVEYREKNILELSKKCQEDGKKRTVIVQGGPGTGKTVVAINLLSELTGTGQFAQYVSKNSAPRNVYLQKL